MKIDKRNPLHWVYLIILVANVVIAIMLRPLLHRRTTGKILLYGHKRNGNLLALHDWVLSHRPEGIRMRYLTMDPAHYSELRRQGIPCILAIGPIAIYWLATADAIVSDHGLHAMSIMIGSTDMKFFDVWHGIPFKGFDAEDFRLQHRFDEMWVPSPLIKQLYVEKFGFDQRRVKVTGYARTDRLIGVGGESRKKAATQLGVPTGKKVVLFAPTWQQDERGRSLFPFGLSSDEFCSGLARLASAANAAVIIRTHLNSGTNRESRERHPGILYLSSERYPDTEQVLLASDILICDWSSIAFDFLLLERPAIFLDVKPPFSKGLSLGKDYRYGAIASDFYEMLSLVRNYLRDPSRYSETFGKGSKRIFDSVYGGFADGMACSRCVDRLLTTTSGR